jgi:hypothetical protein
MTTIRRMGEDFARDRRITPDEAQALVNRAQQNGVVSRMEKLELRYLVARFRDRFDPGALDIVQRALQSLPPPAPPSTGEVVNLDPQGAHRPVFLTRAGAFSLDNDGTVPPNDVALGDAVYRMAALVDDAAGNVFGEAQLPEVTLAGAFETLKGALAKVPAGGEGSTMLQPAQALQLRSSAATVLLHLAEATTDPALRAQMLGTYEGLVRAETNVRLRESLIFHFANSAVAEAGAGKAVAAELMAELAPLSPPYEKWFANGNKTVNLEWTVGKDEFWKGFTDGIKRKGFVPVGPENQHGVTVYEKTFNKPGVGDTTFRISVREGGKQLLEATSRPDVHIMGYDGHSSWGRNMTSSIKGGPSSPDGGDGKLFIYNLCVGKSQLDMLKEKYPNMQAVATFGASYLDTEIDGLCELISRRADWQTMDAFFDRTDGYGNKQNFVTPISTLARERVLDRDNDGQADYLDKHFNFDTFDVGADTRREFQPVRQSRPSGVMDGTKINIAAQTLNTVSEFSSILERVNADSKVVPQGWFEPKLGERDVIRFSQTKGPDGKAEFRMAVNARYGHMSEEALRATAVYEFGKWLQAEGALKLEPVDAKLNGLLGFAQSLHIDESSRDDEVWGAFLDRYNFPEVDRRAIQRVLDAEHRHYAGSPQMLQQLRTALGPELVAKLTDAAVGQPVAVIG